MINVWAILGQASGQEKAGFGPGKGRFLKAGFGPGKGMFLEPGFGWGSASALARISRKYQKKCPS